MIYAFALQDLVKVHKCLMAEIQDSVENRNAENLHQIFIAYKDKYETSFNLHAQCLCVIFFYRMRLKIVK